MNFLSIEYFAAVASEHSFSKAAKRRTSLRRWKTPLYWAWTP